MFSFDIVEKIDNFEIIIKDKDHFDKMSGHILIIGKSANCYAKIWKCNDTK
jgi:hypothetical protein